LPGIPEALDLMPSITKKKKEERERERERRKERERERKKELYVLPHMWTLDQG
jgi:hypothetical protein